MLFRKRMWDIMREEFAIVRQDASLAEAMREMNRQMEKTQECHVVLVQDAAGKPVGVLSMWSILRAMGGVLEDRNTFKERGRYDAEELFSTACKVYASTPVHAVMDRKFPTVKPGEPALAVLEIFLDKGRSFVVVQEAGKVLGLVLASDLYLGVAGSVVEKEA